MDKQTKTILITGASSGIGRETAVRLAKKGYKVYAGIRKKVDKTELESLNNNIVGVYLDITNSGSIEKAFWFIMKQAKKLDILINNAGIATAGPIECLDTKYLKEQFDVNTFGTLAVVKRFIPLLNNSRVINISSMASTGLFPYISPYCASKRAMEILMNSFAIENKDKIQVITIRPASIKTPIWNKSVKVAENIFNECNESLKLKYKNELEFLKNNALKNNKNAIETYVVVDTILKAIESKNPKSIYSVGLKSNFVQLASLLPISTTNNFIKSKLTKLIK